MKKTRLLISVAAIMLMLFAAFSLVSCSDDAETVTGISSIEAKDDTVTLKATLEEGYAKDHSKDTMYILALSKMDPDGSLKGATVVAEGKAKTKMTFKFSVTDDNGASRIAYAFVLAEKNGEKYSPLTEFAYIENPEYSAEKNEGPASTSGIKGVASNDPMGSAVLGVDHFLVEADMGMLIREDYAPGTVRFNYDNVTYFYNETAVELLDKSIADAEKAGMRIYIRTTLSTSSLILDAVDASAPGFLYTADNKYSAVSHLPNLSDERAVRYVKAFYAFLASRYSVCDYIIGEQVNNYSFYCNAGDLDSEEFERIYSFWARISNNVLKSVNSSAKIYVPVDSTWKTEAKNGIVAAQTFLSHFASMAKEGGDYDYAVAINIGKGDDLPALLNGGDGNYSEIGAINLSEFADFLDKSDMRFKSERRDSIIDGLTLTGVSSNKNRAAYYTYTYYTASDLGFDAFIYSDSLFGDNYTRNDMYYAFLMCGSSMNSQLSDYTDKLQGVEIPNISESVSNNLKYVQSAEEDINDKIAKKKKPFPVTLADFDTVGGVFNFQGQLTENGSVWLLQTGLTQSLSGIACSSVPAKDIVNSEYIGITLDSDEIHTLCLLIKNEKTGEQRYTFVGESKTEKGQTTYYFDISEFSKGVNESDKITLALCLVPDGDIEAEIEISAIALYGVAPGSTETTVIVIVVAVIAAALIGLIVLLAVRRKKKTEDGGRYD